MNKKIYLRILQIGLVASLLVVFFLFKGLLFPYITSKQLPFNMLMEILFAVWLVFILRYPEYRPKRSYITTALIVYFLAILASCAVSVNLNLSFWGDAERMLGLFHLGHFLIFYLILITVFRSWREWQALLFVSVSIATVVSLFGLLGPNIYSTIGNTAYVSGYLIFNLFFTAILFLRTRNNWRWFYFAPLFIMLAEFGATKTSGAIIGLSFSVLLLVFLIGLFHKNRPWRRLALIIVALVLAAVIVLFSQHNADWFQNSFLKNLTFQKHTFQTRLISWRGAARDFKYHPLFGTGFGNYALIFDRQFDSKFFNYSKVETYFDRAHNNLIDIVSTTGLVGLLTYLSIFVAVLYYLIREFRKNGGRADSGGEGGQRNLEIIIILALLTAYFIQNLAVFDSLVTYIGLMIVLGFVDWLSRGKSIVEQARTERVNESSEDLALNSAGENREKETADSQSLIGHQWELIILIILLAGALIFANQYNLKPWRMFNGVIAGYGEIASGNLGKGFTSYQQALSGTPLDHDGRTTFVTLIFASPDLLSVVSANQAANILDYAIILARQNVAQNPQDSLGQMQLAQILDTAARFNYQDLAKFNYYSAAALNAIEDSIAASPGRAPVYLVKAQMLLVRGEQQEAIETVTYAISLNPDYPEGYCRLAQFYLLLKEEERINEPLNRCAELGGADDINSASLLMKIIAYYSERGDYQNALRFAERLAMIYGDNAEVWFNLAKLYLIVGDESQGNLAAQKALVLNPQLQTVWTEFKKNLRKE